MRPEYEQAVDAVRWGWSFWISFILPALVIWCGMLLRPAPTFPSRAAVGCGVFVVACGLCWMFLVFHANHIQSTKKQHMQTDAEMEDLISDTWRLFAPVVAIPAAIVYCTLNLIPAVLLRAVVCFFFKRVATAHDFQRNVQAIPRDQDADRNPYRPPQSR